MMIDQQQAIDNLMALRDTELKTPEFQWLIDGIEQWIKQPPAERKSLEHYLGLSAAISGNRSAATLIQTMLRDQALRSAYNALQQNHNVSTWKACGILAEQIRRYRLRRMPRNEIDMHIAQALEIAGELPTTQQRIYDIVTLA